MGEEPNRTPEDAPAMNNEVTEQVPAPPDEGTTTAAPAEAADGENKNDDVDKEPVKDAPVETPTDEETAAEPEKPSESDSKPTIVVSSSKKKRPPYKYDPDKITLRFLFANRDGLSVTIECKPADTVGEVKGALISVWPDGMFVFCAYF